MSTTQTMIQATLSGIGNIIKLLPTGTVFFYQYLNPFLTNNGQCEDTINNYLSSLLIGACGFFCIFSSFTDSYADDDGVTHYGIVTCTGLWTASSTTQDLSSYKLRAGDFVLAFYSLVVFAVVALLDPNTVQCLYPRFESSQKALLMALPPVVGSVTASIFMLFPNTRHGIGYPLELFTTTSTSA